MDLKEFQKKSIEVKNLYEQLEKGFRKKLDTRRTFESVDCGYRSSHEINDG